MAPTYVEISASVREHAGFTPKTCWIAHVKELNGIPTKRAWNRRGTIRHIPCPPDKRKAIEDCLRRLGVL